MLEADGAMVSPAADGQEMHAACTRHTWPNPAHVHSQRGCPAGPGGLPTGEVSLAFGWVLRGHKDRCEHAMLGLQQELLQVRACVQLQDSELRKLRQAAGGPDRVSCHCPRRQGAATWALSPA